MTSFSRLIPSPKSLGLSVNTTPPLYKEIMFGVIPLKVRVLKRDLHPKPGSNLNVVFVGIILLCIMVEFQGTI